MGGPLDGDSNEWTPTEALASRRDVYLIAARVARDAGLIAEAQPEDILELAKTFDNGATYQRWYVAPRRYGREH
jgi:hypothetical protein